MASKLVFDLSETAYQVSQFMPEVTGSQILNILSVAIEETIQGHTANGEKKLLQYLIDYVDIEETPIDLNEWILDGIAKTIRPIWETARSLSPQIDYEINPHYQAVFRIEDKELYENTFTHELARIREGLENGDWYPEHIRRLVGY